jgi:hypothetical protein
MTNKEIKKALLTEGTKFRVEGLIGDRLFRIVRFSNVGDRPEDGLSIHEINGFNAANVERITNNAISCYTFTIFSKKVVDRITFDRITIINE